MVDGVSEADRLAFGLAAATAASLQPARAARCTVPDAILHDRCISKLSVTVRAGRSCAISFTVLCSGRPRAAPPDADRPAVPPGSCFVFNGQRVCE